MKGLFKRTGNKKLVALLIAIVMVAGMLPFSLFAMATTPTQLTLTKSVAVVDAECMEYDITLNVSGILPTTVTKRPIDIVLVLDLSASMSSSSNAGLNALKLAVKGFIDKVAEYNTACRIGIVVYGQIARERVRLTALDSAGVGALNTATDNLTVSSGTTNLNVGNYTDIAAGLMVGKKVLADAKTSSHWSYIAPVNDVPREQMLVLMTDGIPYSNSNGKYCAHSTSPSGNIAVGSSASNTRSTRFSADTGTGTENVSQDLSQANIRTMRMALNNNDESVTGRITNNFEKTQNFKSVGTSDGGAAWNQRQLSDPATCTHSPSNASHATCGMAAAVEMAKTVRADGVTMFSVGLFDGVTNSGATRTRDLAEYFMKNTVANPAYYYRSAVQASLNDMFTDIANIITSGLVVTDALTAADSDVGFTLNNMMFDFVSFINPATKQPISAPTGASYVITRDTNNPNEATNAIGHSVRWTVSTSNYTAGQNINESITFRIRAKNNYVPSGYTTDSPSRSIPGSTAEYRAFTNIEDAKLSYSYVPSANANPISVDVDSAPITSIDGYSQTKNTELNGKVYIPGFNVSAAVAGGVATVNPGASVDLPTITATPALDHKCTKLDGDGYRHPEKGPCGCAAKIAYQWYTVSGSVATPISDATAATYTPTGVTATAGSTLKYLVEATACCDHKASAVATFTVGDKGSITIGKTWTYTIDGSDATETSEIEATFLLEKKVGEGENAYTPCVATGTEADGTFKIPFDKSSKTLSNLDVPGTYRITETSHGFETDNGVNWTQDAKVVTLDANGIATPANVSFSNTKEVQTFEVTKTWEHVVDDEEKDTEEYIATIQLYQDNVEYGAAVEIIGDGSHTWHDLPTGHTYTAAEISYNAGGITEGFECNVDETGAEFTNSLIYETARIRIVKNWEYFLNGTRARHNFRDYTATFYIYEKAAEAEAEWVENLVWIPDPNGEDFKPYDNPIWVADDNGSEFAGNGNMRWVPSESGTAQIEVGEELVEVEPAILEWDEEAEEHVVVAEARFESVKQYETGDWVEDGEYGYWIYGEQGYWEDQGAYAETESIREPVDIVTIHGNRSERSIPLKVGVEYEIVEVGVTGALSSQITLGATKEIVLEASNNVVSFTNTVSENFSSLTISKSWVHTVGVGAPEPITDAYSANFTVTGLDNEYSANFDLFGSGLNSIKKLPDLVPGRYTITESANDYSTAYSGAVQGTGKTAEILLSAGEQGVIGIDATVNFTNTKNEPALPGVPKIPSFVIHKTTTNGGAGTFEFAYSYKADDADEVVSMTNKTVSIAAGASSNSVTVNDLPANFTGYVTVSELARGGLGTGTWGYDKTVYTLNYVDGLFVSGDWRNDSDAARNGEFSNDATVIVAAFTNTYAPPTTYYPTPPPVIPTTPATPDPEPIVEVEDPAPPLAEYVPEPEPDVVVEIDDPAPPLAEFAPEPEETVEIEDPDVPLAELPQTGLPAAHIVLAAIGAALSALGLALGIRARRPRRERID